MEKRTLESQLVLQELVNVYLDHFSDERAAMETSPRINKEVRSLPHFLATTQGDQLYNRTNFNGHLTASAFILSADRRSVLLLHHRSLDRWLQPGGHIDDTDASILDAAYREVFEETNLRREDLVHVSTGNTTDAPFDIDSHLIPANPNKNEDAHVHHDFRFLLQLNTDTDVNISAVESNSYKWIRIDHLEQMEDHARVAAKISALTCG